MSPDVHDPTAILEHARGLRSLAVRLVGPERAEDLVQDTYLKALQSPPGRERPLGPWLVRVLINGSYSLLRRARVSGSPEAVEHEACSVPTPERIAEELDAAERLLEAVGRLAHPASTIVSMRYFREMNSAQIGEALGLPAPTVRWHLQRALGQLRSDLEVRSKGQSGGWVAELAPLLSPLARDEMASALSSRVRSAGAKKVTASAVSAFLPFAAVVVVLAVVLGGVLLVLRGPSAPVDEVALVEDGRPDVIPMIKLLPATPVGSKRCKPAVAMMAPARRISKPLAFGHDQVEEDTMTTVRVGARIVDLAGEAIAGAELRTVGGHFALADDDGRCVLELTGSVCGDEGTLVDQLKELHIVAPGHATRRVSAPLELADLELGDLTVTPEQLLEGQVLSFDGVPVTDVELSAWSVHTTPDEIMGHVARMGRASGPYATTRSDEDGRFRLEGVNSDAVLVAVTSPAQAILSLAEVELPVEEPLELMADQPAQTDELDVHVVGPEGQAIGGAIVRVHGAFRPEELRTDGQGHVRVDVARDGDRFLSAWDADGQYAPAMMRRGEGAQIVLQLAEGAVHHVRVVDGKGTEVDTFDWRLRFHGMVRRGAAESGVARVVLPSERPSCRWRRAALDVLIDGRVVGSARLRVGEPGSEWTVRLDAPVHVEGEVLHDGAPVAGALVTLQPLGADLSSGTFVAGGRAVRTGPSGSFRVEVERGLPHELRVVAAGLSPAVREISPRGETDRLERVELTRGGVVLGRVHPAALFERSFDSGPLIVRAEGPAGQIREAEASFDGTFRLEGLASGPWLLRLVGRDSVERMTDVGTGRVNRVELGSR